MSKQPVAYIRKSRVLNGHSVSWEVQEQAVRSLAGAGDLLILSDWNRSGRGTARRPGYQTMLSMIERDEVSAVYAYSLSRFARSLKDFTALVELCLSHGVPIRFAVDHQLNVEGATATSTLLLNVMAAFAQFDADIARERAREAVAVRRQRGDRIGHPFYGEREGEDAEAVVAAYREAGSVMGAARLLNARGIPTRRGGPWATTTTRETLVRLGAMPARSRPGAKARAPFVLYGLLRCHCGHLLTGTRYRNGPALAYTAYKCHFARTVPDHGLGAVPEKRLLPWVRAEAARLQTPSAVEIEAQHETTRAALAARRQRVAEAFLDGLLDRASANEQTAAIDAELDSLGAARAVVAVPALDWSWEPETINEVLRALWSEVRLDTQLRPLEAVWRVPEWRSDDAAAVMQLPAVLDGREAGGRP